MILVKQETPVERIYFMPTANTFKKIKRYANQPLMNIDTLVSPHQIQTQYSLLLQQGTSLDEAEISSGWCHPNEQEIVSQQTENAQATKMRFFYQKTGQQSATEHILCMTQQRVGPTLWFVEICILSMLIMINIFYLPDSSTIAVVYAPVSYLTIAVT